jgi:uncharacterized surface protein with fasciclin (FAS1) repeats
MTKGWMLACAAALALGACGKADEPKPTSDKAADAAGDKTLAAGLGANAKFAAAVKAAGLEGALAGPTPYTVLAPSDAAFDSLPAGALDRLMKPDARKELTALLSNHILPGTMLTSDIGKAIDAGGGKTTVRTLGGGTLTATRSGDKLQFADAAGTRATVLDGAVERSNGVIYPIDAVLMPAR